MRKDDKAGQAKNTPAATKDQPTEVKDRPEGRQFKTGVAVGIGSAAIVAALLYARTGKPRKK